MLLSIVCGAPAPATGRTGATHAVGHRKNAAHHVLAAASPVLAGAISNPRRLERHEWRCFFSCSLFEGRMNQKFLSSDEGSLVKNPWAWLGTGVGGPLQRKRKELGGLSLSASLACCLCFVLYKYTWVQSMLFTARTQHWTSGCWRYLVCRPLTHVGAVYRIPGRRCTPFGPMRRNVHVGHPPFQSIAPSRGVTSGEEHGGQKNEGEERNATRIAVGVAIAGELSPLVLRQRPQWR